MWKRLLCAATLAGIGWSQPSSAGFEIPKRRPDGKPLAIQQFVAPVLQPRVLKTLPHDTSCYTQGLMIAPDGRCFESSGGFKRSQVRQVELESGKPLKSAELDPMWWAEGLCWNNSGLFLLTWQNHLAFCLDSNTFAIKNRLEWPEEGWGVTGAANGNLLLSDGTDRIFEVNPATLKIARQLIVRDGQQTIDLLNELEYAQGTLYANVAMSDYIAAVDPESGRVKFWLDCSNLLNSEEKAKVDDLNGIAFDPVNHTLLLTGKFWPKLFTVALPGA